eukprot:458247-Rhodomonas_salina.1
MEIRALSDTGPTSKSYRLSVGRLRKDAPTDGKLDNALYLDIVNSPNPDGMSGIESEGQRDTLLKMSYLSEPEGLEVGETRFDVQTRRTSPFVLVDTRAAIESPTDDSYTVRVSMYGELAGGYIKVGDKVTDSDSDSGDLTHFTHIYLDGIVENAHVGWMPRYHGSHARGHEATLQLIQSSEDYKAEVEQRWNMSQVRFRFERCASAGGAGCCCSLHPEIQYKKPHFSTYCTRNAVSCIRVCSVASGCYLLGVFTFNAGLACPQSFLVSAVRFL